MSGLPTQLRRQLEAACKQARKTATKGSQSALESLAVHEPEPYPHMNQAERDLRRKLRAQAKQLGDSEGPLKPGSHAIGHLVEKLAYDQWHRLLFARFLFENSLLMSPEHGVAVTLDDCEELAPALKLKDAWAVAAYFAAKELPDIFRSDDPAGAVEFAVEHRNPLIQLVNSLPIGVFTANDSLGWCYQFWQSDRRDEVNASGDDIGAAELPAVTQLFTEDYMVDFLLDNTLGAWHAGKILAARPTRAGTAVSEEEVRKSVALPGCLWNYLRFAQSENGNWAPAAGCFGDFPKEAKDLKCLDPCMGSGHFVVAIFERLVAIRIFEESIDEEAAVAAVIGENLFGLEIDPRCTQIGAFNLALAAWRRAGHCKLPAMNLACSGLAPNSIKEDWLSLAAGDARLRHGMGRLYELFANAPILGSLIDPRIGADNMFVADFDEVQPLLDKVMSDEAKVASVHEMAVTARGLAKAAEILAREFTLVATNVPYLKTGKQDAELKAFCSAYHGLAKAELATCFVERCLSICSSDGAVALVTPQSWLFQPAYRMLRPALLRQRSWFALAKLGTGAFETISGEVVNVCLITLGKSSPEIGSTFAGWDATTEEGASAKAESLRAGKTIRVGQHQQLTNPEARVSLLDSEKQALLATFAKSHKGITTNDDPLFQRKFWEFPAFQSGWEFHQSTVDKSCDFGGREHILLYEGGRGRLRWLSASQDRDRRRDMQGANAWGKRGVAVSCMGRLPVALYDGQKFDTNVAAVIPAKDEHLPAIWCFCSSPQFYEKIRRIDHALKVTNGTLVKIPFDLTHWQKVATDKYPHGLPKPFSSDPRQWVYDGHPKGSDQALHVAVARLVGYLWPRQTGSSFSDCAPLGADGLEDLADKDGILCISSTMGEPPAAERLRAFLAEALGKFDLSTIIASAGLKGSKSETLEEWLREEFFDQHCALFHHRPFIWQIWDGHKSGFSALVNYHRLTHANLEKITYAHVGDWIRRQQAAVDAGEAGSDSRLQAAKQFQGRLKLILEGEPPYDIFARWKPLSKQAIGWHPDINDGVRMNIRPFATADILRKRIKIKWDKDRGNEPLRDKNDFPWFWGWDEEKQDFVGVGKEPDGNRWNDCHYTNEFKNKAREARKTG